MYAKNILRQIAHRAQPLPNEPWSFYQEWNEAIFLHWKVSAEKLKSWIPPELEIEYFEGSAWISVVIFKMQKIRPKNLPPLKAISNFEEVNIRTYSRYKNKPGVYFLSIEGSKTLSCRIAKNISGLPYRFSLMERTKDTFKLNNTVFNDHCAFNYKIGDPISSKSSLQLSLTEQYGLFNDNQKAIDSFDIHHAAWPLFNVEILNFHIHYPRFASLFSGTPDACQYSPGVQVLAWKKKKIYRT